MKNINEKDNPFLCALFSFCGKLARGIWVVIQISAAFLILFMMCRMLHKDLNTPPLIQTVEAHAEDTHFLVEYYVDGQRYVRTLSYATARLLEGVSKDYGLHSSDLISVCLQEGSVASPDGNYYGCDPEAVGDNGWSLGAFQINRSVHKNIPAEDAKHIFYSAKWTAQRLLRYGYRNNRKFSLQCHNSCNNPAYGDRILQMSKTLKPITL